MEGGDEGIDLAMKSEHPNVNDGELARIRASRGHPGT